MENNSTEESASMRNSANSDGERSPSNTDINDPENLDYEDIDDNHSVKKISDQGKSSMDFAVKFFERSLFSK